jgi:hypothetical protein
MVKWLVAFSILGAMWFVMWKSIARVDVQKFVETPEIHEAAYTPDGLMAKDTRRTMGRVDAEAAESVIRWPAWKSPKVAADPIELRVQRNQWHAKDPFTDRGFIGPDAIRLRVSWPETPEERSQASPSEEYPVLHLGRAHGDFDPLTSPESSIRGLIYSTPVDTPRPQKIAIMCGITESSECNLFFEYRGRPARLTFPRRRFEDWESGYKSARTLLDAIAKPI